MAVATTSFCLLLEKCISNNLKAVGKKEKPKTPIPAMISPL